MKTPPKQDMEDAARTRAVAYVVEAIQRLALAIYADPIEAAAAPHIH